VAVPATPEKSAVIVKLRRMLAEAGTLRKVFVSTAIVAPFVTVVEV
jgi:hypothetical protein